MKDKGVIFDMENMNLNQEQIMILKNKYLQKIDEMLAKNDLKMLKINKKYKLINMIGGIVSGIIGVGLGILISKIVTLIFSGIKLSSILIGVTSISALLTGMVGYKITKSKIKDLSSNSKDVKEIRNISNMYLSMKKKKQLSNIEFLSFINKLNIIFSNTKQFNDIRNKEFIHKLTDELDFFSEYQNRNLISGLMKGKNEINKYYELSDQFYYLLLDNLSDIKEIFHNLVVDARGYHKYNEEIAQRNQQEIWTRMNQNVYSPNQSSLPINSRMQYPPQQYFAPSSFQQPNIVNIQYVNPNVPMQAVVRRTGYQEQFKRDNSDHHNNR